MVWEDNTGGMFLLRGPREVKEHMWFKYILTNGKGFEILSWVKLTLFLHSLIQNEYSWDGFYCNWLSEESLSLPYNFFRIGMAFNVPSLPPPIVKHSNNMVYTGILGIPYWGCHKHISSHLSIVTCKTLKVCKCYFVGVQNDCAFIYIWKVVMSRDFKVRNDVDNAYLSIDEIVVGKMFLSPLL